MYTVGMDVDTRAYFTAATMMIAVPTVLKFLVDWQQCLECVRYAYTNVVWCWFYIFIYHSGLTGIMLSNGGLDVALHDTYYVVAHFIMYYLWVLYLHYLRHFIIGFSFWLSSLFGSIRSTSFLNDFCWCKYYVFSNALFRISWYARRIPDYPDVYTSLNQLCSIGSYISMLGMVLFFVLVYQLLAGVIFICHDYYWFQIIL